jgi:hypothetical protein
MKLHPVIQQNGGIISVSVQAQFVGDGTDPTDKQKIQAFGDPKVNLGGLFTDPSNDSFSFTFPASELYVGVTTEMGSKVARFMTALPVQSNHPQPWQNMPCDDEQGSLDCITTNPSEAAAVWAVAVQVAASAAMTMLRGKSILPSISDVTV